VAHEGKGWERADRRRGGEVKTDSQEFLSTNDIEAGGKGNSPRRERKGGTSKTSCHKIRRKEYRSNDHLLRPSELE